MRLVCFIIVLISACSQVLNAQNFPSEVWHEGKVVLAEGDTLSGLVKYSLENDVVQLSADNKTIKAFTGRKLLYFEIFDKTVERYRQFYSIPYTLNGNYRVPILFEMLLAGDKMTLLCREAVEYQTRSYPYSVAGTYSTYVLVYTYYFLDNEGNIQEYNGKKKDLLYIMKDKQSQMKKYIKDNKINADRRADLAKTVVYYNSLFDKI